MILYSVHLGMLTANGVLVSLFASSAEGRGFDPRPGHLGVKAKTVQSTVRIMCLDKVTGLPAYCFFRELAH